MFENRKMLPLRCPDKNQSNESWLSLTQKYNIKVGNDPPRAKEEEKLFKRREPVGHRCQSVQMSSLANQPKLEPKETSLSKPANHDMCTTWESNAPPELSTLGVHDTREID